MLFLSKIFQPQQKRIIQMSRKNQAQAKAASLNSTLSAEWVALSAFASFFAGAFYFFGYYYWPSLGQALLLWAGR
jgi:hypothetical protein